MNLSVISEENFMDTEVSIDTNHAILLTKENENRTHSRFDPPFGDKNFNTAFTEVGYDRADLKTSELETFSKDFSDDCGQVKDFYFWGI